jgi:hypothetical protein
MKFGTLVKSFTPRYIPICKTANVNVHFMTGYRILFCLGTKLHIRVQYFVLHRVRYFSF